MNKACITVLGPMQTKTQYCMQHSAVLFTYPVVLWCSILCFFRSHSDSWKVPPGIDLVGLLFLCRPACVMTASITICSPQVSAAVPTAQRTQPKKVESAWRDSIWTALSCSHDAVARTVSNCQQMLSAQRSNKKHANVPFLKRTCIVKCC